MKNKQLIFQEKMPACSSPFMTTQVLLGGCMILLLFLLPACATMAPQQAQKQQAPAETGSPEMVTGEPKEAQLPEDASIGGPEGAHALPVRYQQPTYLIKQMGAAEKAEEIVIPVGADITTTTGAVPLRDIIKRLAALKNMNVSWASDVDQYVMTDVDIRASDDFFQAIDNLLRQVDYYHEIEGNTIVIKYKETKKFHIAMPPRLASIASSTSTGNSASSSLSVGMDINRWDDVRTNLDQILEIWTDSAASVTQPQTSAQTAGQTVEAGTATPKTVVRTRPTGKGYYTINESIGLITVTAPRPLIAKIETYVENLKSELYRQISIEAKIVEVIMDNTSKTGLDWSALFEDKPVTVTLMDGTGILYPESNARFISQVSVSPTFDVILNLIDKQVEDSRVLANPKVSVMNGQPAVIYIGDNVTYIDKVTTTVDEGVVSTSVTTAQATSGIRLEVFPTIINEDEIILSLTPMTSDLKEPIEIAEFSGVQVGLPKLRERTMNSIVRVNNGQILVIGGLIDRTENTSETKVQLLGELPVVNRLFRSTQDTNITKELIILLRPKII